MHGSEAWLAFPDSHTSQSGWLTGKLTNSGAGGGECDGECHGNYDVGVTKIKPNNHEYIWITEWQLYEVIFPTKTPFLVNCENYIIK